MKEGIIKPLKGERLKKLYCCAFSMLSIPHTSLNNKTVTGTSTRKTTPSASSFHLNLGSKLSSLS